MNTKETIEFLWSIIDDIDTAGDIAKSDDKLYRGLAEKAQAKRWETGIKSDGYSLDLSSITQVSSEHFETWYQEEGLEMCSNMTLKQVLGIAWSNGAYIERNTNNIKDMR